jgi:tetratricopeptide (TPR) repeat protein
LGQILTARRHYAKAEALLREALDIRQRTLPSSHWRIAEVASLLGECLSGLGQYERAEELLVPAQSTIESAFGSGDRHSLNALRRVCDLYDATGRKAQAIECRSRLGKRAAIDGE